MTALIQILCAFAGAFGFSLVFGIRRGYIWLVSLDGALSWAVYLACAMVMPSFFCNLIAAVFCEVYAAILARIIGVPTTVLLMPATVPMIPGGLLYYAIYYVFEGDFALAGQYGMNLIQTVFALAAGFAITTELINRYQSQLRALFERKKQKTA